MNIASIAALVPSPQLAAYGAAKAGVVHLTRSLALELGPSNIRVNAICPGFLWTRAWEGLAMMMKLTRPEFRDLSPREIFLAAVKQAAPLGREQTPEDIGKLICFLASDDAHEHHRAGDQGRRRHHAANRRRNLIRTARAATRPGGGTPRR